MQSGGATKQSVLHILRCAVNRDAIKFSNIHTSIGKHDSQFQFQLISQLFLTTTFVMPVY